MKKNHAEDQWFILLLFRNKTETKKRIMLMKFWNPQEVVLNGPK